jgi:prepilin-type N-terminal cleavage/methylation domain-containing protein/prepilin-type processing-associated H-X9-DG protein
MEELYCGEINERLIWYGQGYRLAVQRRLLMRPLTCRSSRSGFTLVELLVVIALIIVLVSLATPVVLTVRQNALTATCASNQRNIGAAMIAFVADTGAFPTTINVGQRADNWVYWQNGRNPGMDYCPASKYLNLKGADLKRMLTCPSQPIEDQTGFQGGGAYGLTYSFNAGISVYYPLPLRLIHNPGAKILIYDENQNADDDQFWYATDRDTLAGRHGTADYQKVNLNGTGDTTVNRGLGNVLFVDGHVALVDNVFCHTRVNGDPKSVP